MNEESFEIAQIKNKIAQLRDQLHKIDGFNSTASIAAIASLFIPGIGSIIGASIALTALNKKISTKKELEAELLKLEASHAMLLQNELNKNNHKNTASQTNDDKEIA